MPAAGALRSKTRIETVSRNATILAPALNDGGPNSLSLVAPENAPAEGRRQPGLAAPQSSGAATKMGARPEAPTRMSALRAWKPAPRGLSNLRVLRRI